MTDQVLLAIDAGTGSARAAVFDLEGGQIALAQEEWSHPEVLGVSGSQVFETEANWTRICGCVRRALADSGMPAAAVAAVSATSMREGMVLYDASGAEIWACPNVDARAGQEAAELIAEGTAEEIYRRAGDWVAITAPARLRWIARHEPEVFGRIAHLTMLGDWVLQRLSGEWVTDPSLGSSSGMFELGARTWSPRILGLCGLDPEVAPSVHESGTVVGEVSARAAEQTGLPAGIPVVAGGADTQLALLGIGVAAAGRCTVVGGSFWQHTALLDEPLIDPQGRLRTLCHAVPDQWMIEGIGFWSGLVMRWFRDAFCRAEVESAAGNGSDPYLLLEREAEEAPPGSHGVVGLFSNLMTARHWVHSTPGFLGFDIAHPERSGRRECLRAIEESAAYVSRGHLEAVSEVAGLEVEEIMLAGGAGKARLWPQILADVLGIPVALPVVKETTALGAALLAGVGAGLFADARDAAARVARTERVLEPQPDTHRTYDRLYREWRELYARALELSPKGVPRPLWRAAGT